MRLQKILKNPEDVIVLEPEKNTDFYYRNDPFRTWQSIFTRENRLGRSTYSRNNNNTKIFPHDRDHYTRFKLAGYFRTKPKNTEGWNILYYPAMINRKPGWVAITRDDIDNQDWIKWCQMNGAVASVLNKDYEPYKPRIRKKPGPK